MNETKRLSARGFALALALALAGCGGGGGTGSAPALTPQEHVAQLEASGALPKLERTDTIAGIDANANGVRDDIEQYIEKKYTVPAEGAAAMQMARAYQKTLLVDRNDAVATEGVVQTVAKAVDCIFDTFVQPDGFQRGSEMSRELEAMTTNTKERLKSYLAFNKSAGGSVSGSFKGRSCD